MGLILEMSFLFVLAFVLGLALAYPFYRWKFKINEQRVEFFVSREGTPSRTIKMKPGDSLVVQSQDKPAVVIKCKTTMLFEMTVNKQLNLADGHRVVEV